VVMSGVRSQESTDVEVVLGVDTHLEFHVAVALDDLGRRLGELRVPTTNKGYTRLLCWAEEFGVVRCAGVEGTSSYGAGLARYLMSAVEERGFLRQPLRSVARGGLLRQGGETSPQPRRQPCPAHDLHGAHGHGPAHPTVRDQANRGGQEQARNPALPKAIRRSRGLPRAGGGRRSTSIDDSVPASIIETDIRYVLTMGASLCW
jgi:hypothetical protein